VENPNSQEVKRAHQERIDGDRTRTNHATSDSVPIFLPDKGVVG